MFYSHSTMYLLKLKLPRIGSENSIFTFHHVSIKTTSRNIILLEYIKFTFHHVSIKTSLFDSITDLI